MSRRGGQLYIDPDECIDCDACVEARPVDATTSEDLVPPDWEHYIEPKAAITGRRGHEALPDLRIRPMDQRARGFSMRYVESTQNVKRTDESEPAPRQSDTRRPSPGGGPSVDEMSEWSFPASDPPAVWTWDVGHGGRDET